jgi:PLP dependent protein
VTVAENLRAIEEKIAAACARAGRERSSVVLIGVCKKQPSDRIRAAIEAGLTVLGENYVQELERHAEEFPHVTWHLIGHLQTNKAKKAAALASMIHTVDSVRLAKALGDASGDRKLPVLVEVNLGGEGTKSGASEDALESIVNAMQGHPGLEARGLMCIPPLDEPARPFFAKLRGLRDDLVNKTGLALPDLSMGMSADFEEAILEGATLIRIGTALFGQRG